MEVNGYKIEPGVDLRGAHLVYAKLAGAKLAGANLTGAYYDFAAVTDIDLSGATMPDGTKKP